MAALASYVRGTCPRVQITCRSEFVETSERVGRDLYDEISNSAYRVGEMMYTSLLYPEKSGEVRGRFAEWAPEVLAGKGVAPAEDWGAVFDSTRKILLEDLEALAEELASSADVVGLTTCFGQLFANLTLAQAVKRRAPGVVIVFGGSTVSGRVGPSILTEYACVDY
ncbi:MAG TPA: RiPP maturation radical SAM protein 1, partial [Myxococcaceae bacterium]|nr:RiPP maturation radical SAM protein 1 [Myxococcaceae bacterium]